MAIEAEAVQEVPEGFKLTEIGPLPEDWRAARLGDICQPRRAIVDPKNLADCPYVGLEHIDSGDSRLKRRGRAAEVKSSKGQFHVGDILYGKLRPYLDKAVLAEADGICSTDILVFVADSTKAEPAYLVHVLHSTSFLAHAVSTTAGTNYPRTSWGALTDFLLPLPPLDEQRAIARVLSTIQRAIETTERVIAAARQLKRSLMRHLFTYGPVPIAQAERIPLKETEIGLLPEHWDVVSVGEVADVKGGKRVPKGHKFADKATPYPYIRVVDFKDGSVDKSGLKFLTPEDHEAIKPYIIRSRDVYISIAGTIGLVGVVPEELDGVNLTENAARIVLKKEAEVDRLLLAYFLSGESGQKEIEIRRTKTSQPKLALARIREIPIPCPPNEEQSTIVRLLLSVDWKIKAEERHKATLKELFRTMLHLLMTGQVRVKGLELGNGPAT